MDVVALNLSDEDLRGLAGEFSCDFVKAYCPDELAYFAIMCEQILALGSAAFKRGHKTVWRRLRRRLEGLAFTDKARLKLVTPFVIATTTATLAEINAVSFVPTKPQIANGIRGCAIEFGASRELADQLALSLAPKIHSLFSEQMVGAMGRKDKDDKEKARIVYVDPAGRLVVDKVDFLFGSAQQYLLLLGLLRKERIHWTDGFLLFSTWRSGMVENPRRQFEVVVSRLNKELSRCKTGLSVTYEKRRRRKTGYCRLDHPENILVKSPLLEARRLCEQAERFLHAEEALRRDDECLHSAKMVVEAVFRHGSGEMDSSLAAAVAGLLWRTEKSLQLAKERLQQGGEAAEWKGFWGEVLEETTKSFDRESAQVSAALDRINDYCSRHGILPRMDTELREVNSLVESLRSAVEQPPDDLVERLVTQPLISPAIRRALPWVAKVFPLLAREKKEVLNNAICIQVSSVLMKGKFSADYASHEKFRNSLARRLALETTQILVEQLFDVQSDLQADMRRFRTACMKLKPIFYSCGGC